LTFIHDARTHKHYIEADDLAFRITLVKLIPCGCIQQYSITWTGLFSDKCKLIGLKHYKENK